MKFSIALAVLLCAVAADAQIVRVTSTSEPKTVCRIVNGQKQCGTVQTVEYGSGVIVDRDKRFDYVLTVKHVIEFKANAVHGRPAELVAKHPTEDLALLRTPATTYDVATLGDDAPIGLAVYLDGLGKSGKADAKDYRQARGQITGATTVSHSSRDGDSGGGVAIGSRLYGIITHTNDSETQFVPVSTCLTFCRSHNVCRPPIQQRRAPLPVPPPPRDIPDRQKVQRIEQLESDLAALKKRLDNFKPDHSADVSKKVDRLTVIVQELAAMKSTPGPAGKDGKPGTGPIEVRILSINDEGERRVVRHMRFEAGEPIDLLFNERMLTGEEK